MNNLKIDLAVVLPTLNEADNLKHLIPEIIQVIRKNNVNNFQVLVLDDQSTDNTIETIAKLNEKYENVNLITRKNSPSLPLSIWEGIDHAEYEYVMWLDADGSMTAKGIDSMLKELNQNKNSVIIGSRFVKGGGFKGLEVENPSLVSAIQKVYKSEDSVLAVMLSRIFNFVIYFILNTGIKDVTSGFIVGRKEYFYKEQFEIASYGDYFIYLIKDLKKKNVEMKEVGYICETRRFGLSKSGTSLLILLKRSFPYFKAAFKVNK